MASPKSIGDLIRAMSDEEDRAVSAEEKMTLPPSANYSTMRYPFGGKEGYIKWLKDTGRYFGDPTKAEK